MARNQTKTKKEKILKLIKAINASPRRLKRGLYPLEPSDDGWRIVFPKSLELYDSAGGITGFLTRTPLGVS